jgi:gamma-glutamyltranspeptidase/glutathione hydrolase
MVVAAHPIAAEAGRAILREGGNAVEAAVATSLTLGVVEPQASGLGGGGFMLICPRGKPAETIIIDSRSKISSLLTAARVYSRGKMLPWIPKTGPMSAGIPGLGRALQWALKTFGGKLPLSRLASPAIQAAEEGFEISETFRHCANMFEGAIRHYEETCRIFMMTGAQLKPGERLVQKDLAKTLRTVVDRGFDAIYTGDIGRAMLKEINKTGPVWGEKDLEQYTIEIRKPLVKDVLGHEIVTTPSPSRSGYGIIHTLLAWSEKKPAHHSAEHILFLARTWRDLWKSYEAKVGDPAFFDLPAEYLDRAPLGSPSTTHFTIVDREGTIVTSSQTIGHFFGSGIAVPGTGIVINDDITDMNNRPGTPNSIDAGRRPISNMAPTLVAKGGKPFVALGTPGSFRIFSCLSQVVGNAIGYGMGLEAAVADPRVHWEGGTLFIEGGIDPKVIEEVKQRAGMHVDVRGPVDLFFGGVHAAAMDEQGILGVADPRRDGVALAL